MNIYVYNDLHPAGVKTQFDRVVERLREGDFRSADVRKLSQGRFYRARLNDRDRLLFQIADCRGEKHLMLLEVILNHAYDKSRFLNGAPVDETKLLLLPDPAMVSPADTIPLTFLNASQPRFHMLDRILSFDEAQGEAYLLRPPLILIGSAGSGKTVLTLEKLKQLQGDILYVTLSAYLAENARNLYYSFGYENEDQNVDFLSFREYLESIRVPEGKRITYRDFDRWFARHRQASKLADAHKLFEEFNGVITGSDPRRGAMPREEYLSLGVRRSVYTPEERVRVYDLFEKYLVHLAESGSYDLNLVSHDALDLCRPAYEAVVVDEVQDLTNVQLALILRSLRTPGNFLFCGDANQIVHPNFFSWSAVKTMFHEERREKEDDRERPEIIRVLNANYRNSRRVTGLANRLLLLKNARFGSIDRESTYLVECVSKAEGEIELLPDDPGILKELDAKTRRSTDVAVMVMREEDKAEAKRHFSTPLLFSVQEAKGLEYDHVILYHYVSGNQAEFADISEGVTSQDLEGDLTYARARDKGDKSLETYKFYINALYVALTRAVSAVYLVEKNPGHRLLRLLGLNPRGKELDLRSHTSTDDEWREEARKLELQGKTEQAERIRGTILRQEPVPWRVITRETLPELEKEALDPANFNKQAKVALFEYAVLNGLAHYLPRLAELNFNRALKITKAEIAAMEAKYTQEYRERGRPRLLQKLARYGVNFRDAHNCTPLMHAVSLGMADLAGQLIKDGADVRQRDNFGRTSLHTLLLEALTIGGYVPEDLGRLYPHLAPPSLNIKVDGRLVKLDGRTMEYFLFNAMLALNPAIIQEKSGYSLPAFQTADFIAGFERFPERVLAGYRKKRTYLSSILAKNEVFRNGPYNRKLFFRLRQGFYILNPLLEVETAEDSWTNVYDLMDLAALAASSDSHYVGKLKELVRQIRTEGLGILKSSPPPADAP